MRDGAGNTLKQAKKTGVNGGVITYKDLVGKSDTDDLYNFRVRSRSQFNLELLKTGNGGLVDIQLFTIKGRVSDVFRRIGSLSFRSLKLSDIKRNLEMVASSKRSSNQSIDTVLEAGIYYVRVSQQKGNTEYQLKLSAEPIPADYAGNTPEQARFLSGSDFPSNDDSASPTPVFRDWLGQADRVDYYKFQVEASDYVITSWKFSVEGLSTDADLRLLSNTGQVLQESSSIGNSRELIEIFDPLPGTYYIQIDLKGMNSTYYSLGLSHSPGLRLPSFQLPERPPDPNEPFPGLIPFPPT